MGRPKKEEGKLRNGFLQDLIKSTNNELASLMDEETLSTTTDWINTGSLALNGIICSDIEKGIPNNKVVVFAGAEGTGKTYLVLNLAKEAIKKGYVIAYFDSENSTEKEMVVKRDIDPTKIMYFPVDTAEEFRDQLVKLINKYNENTEEDRPKMMVILDSLGNLSTRKEMRDVEGGKDKQDMTRAKVIKSIFRVLSLKLAKAKVPMLITNHTYTSVGSFIAQEVMGGGCLTKESKILMANKKYKNINEIVIGDFVQTLLGNKEITNIFNYNNKKTIKFEFEDGSFLECTENHKFLVLDNGNFIWKRAIDLNENDFILKNN